MDEPEEQRPRLTPFQRFAVIVVGVMMIITGVATVFASSSFSPYFPAGAVFAPFALAGGALLIALAIRIGKRD